MIEKFIEAKIVKFGNIEYKGKVVVGLDVEHLVNQGSLIDDKDVGTLLEQFFAYFFPDFLDLLSSGGEDHDVLSE